MQQKKEHTKEKMREEHAYIKQEESRTWKKKQSEIKKTKEEKGGKDKSRGVFGGGLFTITYLQST